MEEFNKINPMVRVMFAVPWIVLGIEHYLYVEFVAGEVPAYFPVKEFWVYLTGIAMIAAGISFLVKRYSALAAFLLGTMLLIFIVLIHIPTISSNLSDSNHWTRFFQDLSFASAAFMLADIFSEKKVKNLQLLAKIARYVFALCLIAFGIEQFFDFGFLTAKVPLFLPLRFVAVYLIGAWFIITGATVMLNKSARLTLYVLGALLLLVNIPNYIYLLSNDVSNALLWTGAMLDLLVTGGVFILAGSTFTEEL